MNVQAAAPTKNAGKFVCPECGRSLAAKKAGNSEGTLSCSAGHSYPIVRGLPRFVSSEAYAESFGVEWQRFPRVQLDSYNGTKISLTRFIQLTGIDPKEMQGKRILDAGCGPGRFLELMAEAGAEAYGADMSLAAEVAERNLGSYPNVAIVQADLFHLPFADDSFDLVYCIGVLHHTPNPEAAFRALVKHVKPGGRIAIWVYGLGVSSGIRAPWIPRPHQIFGPFFQALPLNLRIKALIAFTRFALAAGSVPIAGRLLRHIFWIDDIRRAGPMNGGWEKDGGDQERREKIRLEWAEHSAFDAYTTKYIAQTPHDEAVRWARDAGLVDIVKSRIPSAIVATKPA